MKIWRKKCGSVTCFYLLLCKMRKAVRMQRTTDMNILLNMSLKLNGFWLDMKIWEKKIKQLLWLLLLLIYCYYYLLVISFLSLMVDRIWFTEEINIHSFFFYLFYILHIVVPYKKFAEVNVWLPELIWSVHMFDIYKTKRQIILK